MASVDIQRHKNTSGSLVKNIYNAPNKWLISDKLALPRIKRDIVLTDTRTNHVYENVEYKRSANVNKDCNLHAIKNNLTSNFNESRSEKLRTVIHNFDKILNEYKTEDSCLEAFNDGPIAASTPKKDTVNKRSSVNQDTSIGDKNRTVTKIPKLVKAKTCSIIESKCIYKKSFIHSNLGSTNLILPKKTKSMNNIHENNKNHEIFNSKRSPDKMPKSTTSHNSSLASKEKKLEGNNTNVKDIIKRLNSLTELNTPSTASNTFDNEVDVPTKHCVSNSVPSRNVDESDIIKSKDNLTLDITSKKLIQSKIPVNTSLRKIYPSIPCDLNSLDFDRSSVGGTVQATLNKKFTKSANHLNVLPMTSNMNRNRTQSIQHLNLVNPKMSLPKSHTTFRKSSSNLNNYDDAFGVKIHKSLNKSTQNLSRPQQFKLTAKTNSVYNLTFGIKYPEKSFQSNQKRDFVAINPRSPTGVKTLAKTFDTNKENSKRDKIDTKVYKKLDEYKKMNKSNMSIQTDKLKNFSNNIKFNESKNGKQDQMSSENACENHYTSKLNHTVIKKSKVNVEDKPFGKPKLIKSETFKITNKRENESDQMKNVQRSIQITVKKAKHDAIKLNSKTTQEFLKKIKVGDGNKLKHCLQSPDLTNNKIEKIISYLDKDGHLNKLSKDVQANSKKHLDYNSDNSDDSGNISNEIELDSEETNALTKSRSTAQDVPITGNETESKDKKKIFFRDGVLPRLESERDARLSDTVVRLQAQCRGYLARKQLARCRLQETAVRCIQRNVRRFVAVRDWPWWRLLVRVTPLLDAHRTERELRRKTEELEIIKAKLEKSEVERTKLKYENDKLEGKLSEMTADLAEEHSTATLAAERLDAETSERLKLEKELTDVQQKNKELHQSSERLEMELLYAHSDLNGILEEEEDGEGNDGGVYKQRYERAVKELEFTKRRLQQQHEDDLEQLVGLKKQLEKKLADAYEEVEEQRQVVGQWKRKVQKLNGEMNDLRLLLEEQSARNNLLEKKQRKFDSETQMLQDELKKERQTKERLAREKEVYMAEKYAIETSLADTKLELDLKDEKISALQREFDEITCGGKTEEEVTILRKQKIDCERRLQDQEEELDELAGQVQLLEQAKLRLEMSIESMRKEAKKEAQIRDEEMEEVRCNAQKKVKALEQQLENEHEERTLLLRERHELERRLAAAAESERHDRAGDEALLQRLKRDLKRTKALLRDTQAQLERQKAETPGKAIIRQLKNQLEDVECARALAVKTKQSLEMELTETQALLDEAHRQKNEAEERANTLTRTKDDLQIQLEENEEELAEVLKKFKGTVQQMSLDQLALQEQVSLVSELEIERNQLKEQLAELTSRLESVESMGDPTSNLLVKRSELKVKELESKLELEQTTRSRLEVQITRLKEAVEKLQIEITSSRAKEQQSQEQIRKLQRQLREIKEELNKRLAKESEAAIKKKELEKRYEALEAECSTTKTDLRLALKRIEDLQSAIQGDLEDSISDNSESEQDTYSSDDSVNTFLSNNKSSSFKLEKPTTEVRRLSSSSRSSTSNNLVKEPSYT